MPTRAGSVNVVPLQGQRAGDPVKGRRALRTLLPCAVALISTGSLAGCGGDTASSSKEAQPSAAQIEHSEEVAEKQAEAQELAKDRELLTSVEAGSQEEAAETKAKKIEAAAKARAKKKEEQAAKRAKEKEKAAEANAKKREEAYEAQAKQKLEATRQREADERKEAERKAAGTVNTRPSTNVETAPARALQGKTPSGARP
jgi:hypothetical protein